MSRATTVPSSSPNVVAEKARSEKPLSISSTAIISQPKPKPMTMPDQGGVLLAGKLRAHLADGVAAGGAEPEKQNADDPEWRHGSMGSSCAGVCGAAALVSGALCGHKMPHKPRRFKLLVVMPDCRR